MNRTKSIKLLYWDYGLDSNGLKVFDTLPTTDELPHKAAPLPDEPRGQTFQAVYPVSFAHLVTLDPPKFLQWIRTEFARHTSPDPATRDTKAVRAGAITTARLTEVHFDIHCAFLRFDESGTGTSYKHYPITPNGWADCIQTWTKYPERRWMVEFGIRELNAELTQPPFEAIRFGSKKGKEKATYS